jgi:hypothetical protein
MTIEKDLEKTTLATFNVKLVEWEKFKDMAKKDGRAASYFLNEFIKQSISKGSIGLENDTESISPIDTSEVSKLRSEFDTAIAQLETKFDDKLGEFKSLVFETARTLEGMKAAIAPLTSKIESLESEVDGLKKLELAA